VSLPHSFVFSQASLQDYTDCPRRFQLRHLLGILWPARSATDVEWERLARQGSAFHQLVHQHIAGLPVELLSARATDAHLEHWWHAYLAGFPPDLPTAARHSEVHLSTPLGAFRLAARYDLLAIEPEHRAVIVDWKTSERRPMRTWLEARWQTRVYRYVLAKAGAEIGNGRPFSPEQIDLIYWFANFAPQVERFPYRVQEYRSDEMLLMETTARIAARTQDTWPLTQELSRCRYCTYQTLCDREPANEGRVEPELEQDAGRFDIDIEQIAEVEF
jgi:CRISPR/Cas system-associated exonuclease Cas4 (RecB family)